ncbi:signal transduction histidine kinase [Thermosporothrix hazakensis]|jgi:signal transduction histidine kinase|uniref:histidine kinase n=2 Tax=Thermosporothrix hazakensis TaxID=644383 RepID=A0A326UDE8_THEHA|nr:signal transduction histidine kinase [Thermosporothrix hazakensis]GCE47179.1 hybrid sensor histidine kinase/response regulator [Thermosporothrix hazakensis]
MGPFETIGSVISVSFNKIERRVQSATMNTPHILIVDDDVALLQALPQTLQLRLKDVQVETSDTADKALELIQKYDYDAIISDIKMPGMDGLELLSKIQELRPDTPTLLITGHGEYDLAIRALRGGAYDYILKPIDRDAFVAALQRAIQAHQLRRQVKEQHLALAQHAKTLEWQVQKRTSELIAANEMKEKLMRIVAHELKIPLSGVLGLVQLLQRQVESGEDREVLLQGLKDIEQSVSRTDILIQDLLDTSLMESNMFVLRRQPFDLVAFCKQMLSTYTGGSGPLLTTEIVGGEPVLIDADRDRICQVLLNLLSNARKYSPKGSAITITIMQHGYNALISVQDEGIGIMPEEQGKIFDQFYRVPDVHVLNGERPGLGLGLFIARKVVERHGGKIEVESTEGKGSTFTVALPVFVDPDATTADASLLEVKTHATWTLVH